MFFTDKDSLQAFTYPTPTKNTEILFEQEGSVVRLTIPLTLPSLFGNPCLHMLLPPTISRLNVAGAGLSLPQKSWKLIVFQPTLWPLPTCLAGSH